MDRKKAHKIRGIKMSMMDLAEWQKKAEEETRRLKRVEDTVKKNNELLRWIVKTLEETEKYAEEYKLMPKKKEEK